MLLRLGTKLGKTSVFLTVVLLVFFNSPNPIGSAAKTIPLRAKVLLFYVDGLRPDTVDEMTRQGKLPNIKQLFYEKGVRFANCYTTFPSNTVMANGQFMTGKWSENSGLKTQALFERFETDKKKRQRFLFWKKQPHFPRQHNLLTDTDVAPRILKTNKTRALYSYLGEHYHASIVPVNPYPTPLPWPHIAVNTVKRPWLVTTEAPEKLDTINAAYAFHYMVPDRRADVFLIWFPVLDEEQHRDPEGQFGKVREHLVEVDVWMGKIYNALQQADEKRPIYTFLFSDHGAYGGKKGIYNQPFHISRDFFYQTLKMNVRGPDFSITHPGTNKKSFAYIDNMGRGQAKVYLPVGDITSRNWNRPNTFYELKHYGRGPNRQPVNLIEELLKINLEQRNVFPKETRPFPVEFVFVKISEELIFIKRNDGSEGLIWIKKDSGKETYRYMPVKNFDQLENGKIRFEETGQNDPFQYLANSNFNPQQNKEAYLKEYHDQKEWLLATYQTDYPDAIAALAKGFLWSKSLSHLAKAQDPDLTLSAAPGWNFRTEDIPGADHGSIQADSMRATLMISGPDLKKGVIETPHRLIEITPTIFEMIQYQGKMDFDELPLQEIYET